MRSIVKNLFLPLNFCVLDLRPRLKITAIIPSYKPGDLTYRLVGDILRWNNNVRIFVVDDSTPLEHDEGHRIFKKIDTLSSRVTILRTPENKLKAAAINFALTDILNQDKRKRPDVILTLDDDVIISRNTIKNLVKNLHEDERIGVVCSQCRVINKNKNLLTRLQGLEYLGFNGTRLADEGFFRGPLVMHGMLSAFRTEALRQAGLFTERHLIEDYEITARIKARGWHVRLAPFSYAWTFVPETFPNLWRQRARWNVGGLYVISQVKNWHSVIQDLIGHSLFLISLFFIVLSFIFVGHPGSVNPLIPFLIVEISVLQVLVWFSFQIWFMRFYREKDWLDWLIRLTIFPEFIYANVLTLVLFGSYVFYFFCNTFTWLVRKSRAFSPLKHGFDRIFGILGYSESWGTRQR